MNYVDESNMSNSISSKNRNNKLNSIAIELENNLKREELAEVQLSLSLTSSPKSPTFKSASQKVSECLYGEEVVDLDKLRKLSWNGIPEEFRGICWKMLMVIITLIHFNS